MEVNSQEVTLSTGVVVSVTQIANVAMYNEFDDSAIVEPKPPTYEQYGVTHENKMHPVWHDAISVYNSQRIELAFQMVLELAVTFDKSCLGEHGWAEKARRLRRFTEFVDRGDAANFLIYYAVKTLGDKGAVANAALLTEERVYRTFSAVPFTRNGLDIHAATLKNAIDTGVQAYPFIIGNQQLVSPLDEYSACKDAGMSWERWLTGSYGQDTKATTVAMYRVERLVGTHQDDAVQIESERRSKTK